MWFKRGKKIEVPELPSEVVPRKPSRIATSGWRLEEPTLLARPRQVSMPISLTVNVSDVTDIKKLREILRAIKEELLEENETE